jgi:hypothetical protein
MSPLSTPVLLGTLAVGWPALWAAQVDGTLSTDVAFQRLLLCLVASWAACTLVATVSGRVVEANTAAERAIEQAIAEAEAEKEAEAAARAAEMERPADAASG